MKQTPLLPFAFPELEEDDVFLSPKTNSNSEYSDVIQDLALFESHFGKLGQKKCCKPKNKQFLEQKQTPTLRNNMSEEEGYATEAERFGATPAKLVVTPQIFKAQGHYPMEGTKNNSITHFSVKQKVEKDVAPIGDFSVGQTTTQDNPSRGIEKAFHKLNTGADLSQNSVMSPSLELIEQLGLDLIPGQKYYHSAVFRESVYSLLKEQEIQLSYAKMERDTHFQLYTEYKKYFDETKIALLELRKQKRETFAIKELKEQIAIKKLVLANRCNLEAQLVKLWSDYGQQIEGFIQRISAKR